MTPLIRLENVSYKYDGDTKSAPAVNNISLSIEKGSFTALLGRNGSGKSTLAKLFNGLIVPSSGKVTVNGLDTADESVSAEIKRTVGMVFQNPDNQLVATAVDEDVAFGLENIGVPRGKMDSLIDEALHAVGMTEYKYFAPSNLSGGQKQRVAIAGILAMNPECIVLDEPTSMLDPAGRKEVIDTVVSLCRERGVTVVLITHFMEEAVLADRIAVVDKGSVVLDGSPSEVFMNVETLRHMDLEAPAAEELLYELKKSGVNIDTSALDEETCVKIITNALQRKKK